MRSLVTVTAIGLPVNCKREPMGIPKGRNVKVGRLSRFSNSFIRRGGVAGIIFRRRGAERLVAISASHGKSNAKISQSLTENMAFVHKAMSADDA